MLMNNTENFDYCNYIDDYFSDRVDWAFSNEVPHVFYVHLYKCIYSCRCSSNGIQLA